MDALEIKEIFDRLRSQLNRQIVECDAVDSWMRPELARGFDLPLRASREHRSLADLSRTPWLRLVVDNVVQAMYVDSVVDSEGKNDALWRLWMSNGMQSLQVSNHRAMIAYGHSYGLVTRAVSRGKPTSRIRFLSPRVMSVEYADVGIDAMPSAALEALADKRFVLRVPGVEYELVAGEALTGDAEMAGLRIVRETRTNLDFVPVVRFANQLDLDGRVVGEVEPFIPTARRINKTSYDRLLAQHFNSWKVKTATGLELPSVSDEFGDPTDQVDQAAAERMKTKLAQDDILIAESPDTRFGTLDATSLDPFVNSWRSDIEALAAVSQTPAHALTGQMVNLSAEALAAARAPLTQKVYERQMNAGASYARVLRIAALMAGLQELADDDLVRVTWQDMEIRSMSQAVDALGKAAQMLNVPARALWRMIPGVEAADVQDWERMADEADERDPLMASFKRQAESTIAAVDSGVAGG